MGELVADRRIFRAVTRPNSTRTKRRSRGRIRFILRISSIFDLEDLGDISDWQAEWKWDGIRAQVIKRAGRFLSGRAAKT